MEPRPYSPAPLESRSLLVLHATVTGTSTDVAERIARRGRREGWSVAVKGAGEFNRAELLDTPLIVFVLPTTGNGAAPPSFVPLWTSLLHPALPVDILEDLRFAVFGLGDSSYGKYNWVGRKMFRRLEGLGAKAVVERGEGDDQNEWGIESTFPDWLNRFYEAIDPLFPVAHGFTKRPAEELPPPRIRLKKMDSRTSSSRTEDESTTRWAPDVRVATVRRIARVTPSTWFQDVRTVSLEFEDETEHVAGDVLEIRPHNSEEDVNGFLTSVGWGDVADTLFSISATSADQPLPPHLPSPYLTTLRDLLAYELDISSVPRLSFFEWLAFFSEGDMQEKLRWFCTGEGQDDLTDYTLRPRRTILEVMYEFRTSNVPPEYILDLLPPLRARGFSIASSAVDHPGTIELLIAIVKYRTSLSIPRKGVCTSYIATLSPGDKLAIRLEKGMLNLPPSHPPLIMVGPGTGVAPFRALIEERVAEGSKENLLFFGCRSVHADFYYKDEWEQKKLDGNLVLSVAPSRDQEDKIYVQHQIPAYAKQIWDYLERGGYIYVCGSSTSMPKAVKKAFLGVFQSEGGLTVDDSEKLWDALDKKVRIVEETWG